MLLQTVLNYICQMTSAAFVYVTLHLCCRLQLTQSSAERMLHNSYVRLLLPTLTMCSVLTSLCVACLLTVLMQTTSWVRSVLSL